MGCIIKVDLIKYATSTIGCQRLPVKFPELSPLGKQSYKIGFVGYLLSTHQPIACRRFSCQQLLHHFTHLCQILHHRKEGCRLSFTSETVIDIIDTHHILALAHRNDIHTLSGLQPHHPVVLRNACNDVVSTELPVRTYTTVLYPQTGILLRQFHMTHGILNKDRGMGFPTEMHNLALVVDEVLDSERR